MITLRRNHIFYSKDWKYIFQSHFHNWGRRGGRSHLELCKELFVWRKINVWHSKYYCMELHHNIPAKKTLHTSCCRLVNSPGLAISWSLLGSFWKLSTSRLKARHTLSTLFLSCCVSRFARRDSESATKWNSSAWRFWQQLDVMANAARWALILKKSRYIRQAATPRWNNVCTIIS